MNIHKNNNIFYSFGFRELTSADNRQLTINNSSAFVLIWVLLCMGVMTGIFATTFVAIFQERKALLYQQEVLRAEAALQAALANAQAILCKAIAQYPDSASVWEERLPGLGTPGTALHILQRSDSTKRARVLILPLTSGVQEPQALGQNPFKSLPAELCNLTHLFPENGKESDNSNSASSGGEKEKGKTSSVFAPWVSLRVGEKHPLLARYAFILEDESFKLNIQDASLENFPILRAARDMVFTQKNAWKPFCTAYSEALNLTRCGLPRVNIKKLFVPTASPQAVRRQLDEFIAAIRRESPHFGQRFYRPRGVSLDDTQSVSKKHEEIYLNKLAVNVRDFLLPGPNPTRILDTEGYPVLSASTHLEAPRAVNGSIGSNPLAAIGKKRIPYLQEYVLVTQLIKMQPATKDQDSVATAGEEGAKFEIAIDHFLEFWNLGNKPIRIEDLGSEAKLVLRNQPEWNIEKGEGWAGGYGIPPANQRALEIPLADFKSFQGREPLVFLPGRATVLTTFPEQPLLDFFPQSAQFFTATRLDPQKRKFSGKTYRIHREGKTKWYEVSTRLRNSGGLTDHDTEYLLVNQEGWLDGFSFLPIIGSIAMRQNNGTLENDIRWHIRGSGLQGESEGASQHQMGDPRTLNEQLYLGEIIAAGGKNRAMSDALTLLNNPLPRTRFLRNAVAFSGKSSLGAVYSPFFYPEKWPDPLFSSPGRYAPVMHALSPAVFPEEPIKSIAELGHVFDPVRNSQQQIERDRGGGRTLRIGQPEFYSSSNSQDGQQLGIWTRDPLSPSREWTAWRLCDIFSITDQLRLPGAININGILRTKGAVLRALLHGFRWDHAGCSELAGSRLETEDIDLLISHFQKRLRREPPYQNRGGPFFERGEISEIDLFQSADPFPVTFANRSYLGLAHKNDRVREEIVRYILELITTRGNIFSAYCVGQAIRVSNSNQLQILATRKAKFTFRLVPLDSLGKRMDQNSYSILSDNNEKAPARCGIELLARED